MHMLIYMYYFLAREIINDHVVFQYECNPTLYKVIFTLSWYKIKCACAIITSRLLYKVPRDCRIFVISARDCSLLCFRE